MVSTLKRVAFVMCLAVPVTQAGAQSKEIVARIEATKIGETVTFTMTGCQALSDKDDVSTAFDYTAPSGFQIRKVDVPQHNQTLRM